MQKSLGFQNSKGKENFLPSKTLAPLGVAYWQPMDKSWQDIVRRELKRQKKTQAWLASCLGVSEPTFSSWMHGRHNPDLPELREIAKLLRISITEMLENDDSIARTEKELAILRKFRNIPESEQDLAASLVDAVLEKIAPVYHDTEK